MDLRDSTPSFLRSAVPPPSFPVPDMSPLLTFGTAPLENYDLFLGEPDTLLEENSQNASSYMRPCSSMRPYISSAGPSATKEKLPEIHPAI